MDDSKKIETRRDTDGTILVRGKCFCCKYCWIRLSEPNKGKCVYGGPFEGVTKDDDLELKGDRGPAPKEG